MLSSMDQRRPVAVGAAACVQGVPKIPAKNGMLILSRSIRTPMVLHRLSSNPAIANFAHGPPANHFLVADAGVSVDAPSREFPHFADRP